MAKIRVLHGRHFSGETLARQRPEAVDIHGRGHSLVLHRLGGHPVEDRLGVRVGHRWRPAPGRSSVLEVAQFRHLGADEMHGMRGEAAMHKARVVHEQQCFADLPQQSQCDDWGEAFEL